MINYESELKTFTEYLDKEEWMYSNFSLEKIFKNDENPFFVTAVSMISGIGNYKRKPRPRYYSTSAVQDFHFYQIGVEAKTGHIWDEKTTILPSGLVVGSFYSSSLYSSEKAFSLIYIADDKNGFIEKVNTGIITGISADTQIKQSTMKMDIYGEKIMVDFVSSITKVNSVDFVNKDKQGIEGAGIIFSGYYKDYLL